MKIEVCCPTANSCLIADRAGAARIEFCSALELGGLSPSLPQFKKVRKKTEVPIYILIRPRAGGFNYSDFEYDLIKAETHAFLEAGADGIVCGFLDDELQIDLKRTEEIMDFADGRFTFHRAFDILEDQEEGLKQLADLGVRRVLTSGGKETAIEGLEQIKMLHEEAVDDIIIMPGAGINSKNIHLFKEIGIEQIHLSGKRKLDEGYFESALEEIVKCISVIGIRHSAR